MTTKRTSNSSKRGRKKRNPYLIRWASKIGWKRRVKAVCKPCWELKYCPYGALVEQLPLRVNPDERACRIFGHDCPVFHVAEPFTETRELRNISRSIPRNVQFRVLKRENQICRECGRSVQDKDVEFDHVIPYSKGGSSDESNVRLLCKTCNRKRGASFEAKFLVDSIRDHLIEPSGIEVSRVAVASRSIWTRLCRTFRCKSKRSGLRTRIQPRQGFESRNCCRR
jgi:HNH endonuclease